MRIHNFWHVAVSLFCYVNSSFFIFRSSLKGRWLQPEADRFFQIEHQIHVVYGLAAGSFQQVVYTGNDKELVTMLFQMYKAFVGVDNLLQIYVLVDDMRKGVFGVILFVHTDNLFQRHFGLYHDSGKNAAGKIAAVGDEIDVRIKTVLELFE